MGCAHHQGGGHSRRSAGERLEEPGALALDPQSHERAWYQRKNRLRLDVVGVGCEAAVVGKHDDVSTSTPLGARVEYRVDPVPVLAKSITMSEVFGEYLCRNVFDGLAAIVLDRLRDGGNKLSEKDERFSVISVTCKELREGWHVHQIEHSDRPGIDPGRHRNYTLVRGIVIYDDLRFGCCRVEAAVEHADTGSAHPVAGSEF